MVERPKESVMDVVISGASGLIGSALVRSLEADGHRAVQLVRPSSESRAGVNADSTVAWDPDAGTIDAAALEGVDAVINLAGAGIGDKKWTPQRKRELVESRTRGTALLASAMARLADPPAVFVTGSAVGYYGNRGDEVLTEESGPGDDFLADLCVQWEDAARPAAEAGLRVTWVRTGLVLARHGGVLSQMLLPFRLGLGGRSGSGRQYRSWVTLADEVRGIRHIIDDPALGGPVDVTAPSPVTDAEFAATLGRVLRRPAKLPTPIPILKIRYGAELVQHLLLDGQRVLPSKLLDAGFEFAHPDLEAALRAVLNEQ
jgi:uncharacterized protein (TIGR01777 family)